MSETEILLREHVKNLGRVGDVVSVKSGFARNYLLPRKLAVPATEENKKVIARRRERIDAEEAALLADVEQRLAALSDLTLETAEKADEGGNLYGSVGAQRIVELLRDAGQVCEEREVRLEKPIKAVGTHEVEVHVRGEHSAVIRVEVRAEG